MFPIRISLVVAFAWAALGTGCSFVTHWDDAGRPCDSSQGCATGYVCQNNTCISGNSLEGQSLCRAEDGGLPGYVLTLYSQQDDGGARLETLPRGTPFLDPPIGNVEGRVVMGKFFGTDGGVVAMVGAGDGGAMWVGTRAPGAPAFALSCQQPAYDVENGIGQRVVAGDFDGDGDDDIALFGQYLEPNLYATIQVVRFFPNACTYTGDLGWWSSADAGTPHTLMPGRFVAGDFDSDGKDDVAALYGGGAGAKLYVYRSSGTTFSEVATWDDPLYDEFKSSERFLAGDFSGDGFTDVAAFYDVGQGVSNDMEIHQWTAGTIADGGFNRITAWRGSDLKFADVTGRAVAVDVDKDGKADIVSLSKNVCGCADLLIWRSSGSAFTLDPSRGHWCPDGLADPNGRLMVWPQ